MAVLPQSIGMRAKTAATMSGRRASPPEALESQPRNAAPKNLMTNHTEQYY